MKAAAAVDYWSFMHYLPFQHTATRRWLQTNLLSLDSWSVVSTHSRAEAAATKISDTILRGAVSTHSRAEVTALEDYQNSGRFSVSTHSHPKVAAPYIKNREKSAY